MDVSKLFEPGEIRRLSKDETIALYKRHMLAQHERAERLQQALAGLESAVRILDVMLREPAAEGLMSAEDYRSYVQGAWLGVDQAAEKARTLLNATKKEIQNG